MFVNNPECSGLINTQCHWSCSLPERPPAVVRTQSLYLEWDLSLLIAGSRDVLRNHQNPRRLLHFAQFTGLKVKAVNSAVNVTRI